MSAKIHTGRPAEWSGMIKYLEIDENGQGWESINYLVIMLSQR